MEGRKTKLTQGFSNLMALLLKYKTIKNKEKTQILIMKLTNIISTEMLARQAEPFFALVNVSLAR